MDIEGGQIETIKEQKSLGQTDVELWLKRIDRQIEADKDWVKEAKASEAVYEGEDQENMYFNILHSNTETLTPALYNSQPVPDVRRRFDTGDRVSKMVIDIVERMLVFSMDQYDFDDVAEAMVKDSYVAGRGVTRIRYNPEIGNDVIMNQSCEMEHVAWDMFIQGPAKSWAKVPWVAFKHYLTRDELVRLSPERGKEIDLTSSSDDNERDDASKESDGAFKTALVYEIWDKTSKQIIFIAENDKEYPIKVENDILGLSDFFPCPKPLQHIKRLRSLVPVCPYNIYKDLVVELNDITKRIQNLILQLKVKGLVDAQMEADFRSLKDAVDGEYFPAENGTAFAQGAGGIASAIAHWPLDPIIQALQQLYVQREQVKQTIYEVTGVSDILRGASDARETLGAQQIKTQWGSLRIQTMQNEVAKWARDVFRKKTDLYSKHYEPEVISKITSIPDIEDKEDVALFQEAMQIFNSEMIKFKIDVETDSTIRADMVRSQDAMNQFLTSTGQFAQAMGGIIQFKPELLPLALEIYTAFARKFKLGKQAEDALDQLQSQAEEQKNNPQPEKPDPAQEQAAQAAQMEQQKFQMEQQAMQGKMQVDQAKAQIDQQKAQYDMQAKQMDAQLKEMEIIHKERMAALEIQIKETDLLIKRQSAEIDSQAKIESLAIAREMGNEKMRQQGASNG